MGSIDCDDEDKIHFVDAIDPWLEICGLILFPLLVVTLSFIADVTLLLML